MCNDRVLKKKLSILNFYSFYWSSHIYGGRGLKRSRSPRSTLYYCYWLLQVWKQQLLTTIWKGTRWWIAYIFQKEMKKDAPCVLIQNSKICLIKQSRSCNTKTERSSLKHLFNAKKVAVEEQRIRRFVGSLFHSHVMFSFSSLNHGLGCPDPLSLSTFHVITKTIGPLLLVNESVIIYHLNTRILAPSPLRTGSETTNILEHSYPRLLPNNFSMIM